MLVTSQICHNEKKIISSVYVIIKYPFNGVSSLERQPICILTNFKNATFG